MALNAPISRGVVGQEARRLKGASATGAYDLIDGGRRLEGQEVC